MKAPFSQVAMNMDLLNHEYDDPRQNLAYEEWLFSSYEQESLRLWINPKSVVVGKHQNALSECNLSYCLEKDIPVVRRISGGGTVFHDKGNLNFSFFRWVDKERMIDYDRSLILIQESLQALGYPVEMNERHDLFLNGKKVSGNAQHLRKGRSLHHGTILYDANLDNLRHSIKRERGTFTDKAVRSVRSPIANLREYKDLGSPTKFKELMVAKLQELGLTLTKAPTPSEKELEAIIADRYTRDDWNFGYSPTYEYFFDHDDIVIHLLVARGGEIKEAEVDVDGRAHPTAESMLLGKRHFYRDVTTTLQASSLPEELTKRLIAALF